MAGERPDRDTWRRLMRSALRIVDSLERNGYGTLDFRLGGGTVLMFRFDHRISKDIDLFIDDAQALSFITPRLNDVAAAEITDYQEQGNAIKLVLDGGDIDVVLSGTVIPGAAAEALEFDGRVVALDATCEILAKKMLYRAESFKARDVFDMSAALALDRRSAVEAIRATRPVHQALLRRLASMNTTSPADLLSDVMLTPSGHVFADRMVERLVDAVRDSAGPVT